MLLPRLNCRPGPSDRAQEVESVEQHHTARYERRTTSGVGPSGGRPSPSRAHNDYDNDDGDTYNMRTCTTTTTSARVQQRRPVRSPSRVGTGRHHNPAAAEHLLSLVTLGYSFSELDSSVFVV